MALKMGKLGTYSKDNANTYANPTIRFDDGLLRRSDFVGNPQTQFVNNMQKDPGLTLATTIGGLLGSYVGSNVEQNGIRKGTEMAQSMLDNMKSSGRLDGRNYAVEENGMISLNNPDAKSTLNGAIDYSATSPAPGIGIVQDYMSKYANEPNPIQYQNDMNRATDFVKQSEGQLFANATPDEVRNMIRRQAMAEGRSSQQIDKIMSNIDPEINASYNKYMDEKDAGNYTAALGYLKEGRFQDAMNLASQINNPKLLQALNTAGNYAMQEENLRLKREMNDENNKLKRELGELSYQGKIASAAAKGGRKYKDGYIPLPSELPSGVVQFVDLDPRFEPFINSDLLDTTKSSYNPKKELIPAKKDDNTPAITVHDVRVARDNWRKNIVNYNENPEALAKEAENISTDIQNSILPERDGFKYTPEQVVGTDRNQRLLNDPVVQQAVRESLTKKFLMEPTDNGISGMLERIRSNDADVMYANKNDKDIAVQYEETEKKVNDAKKLARRQWLQDNYPKLYNIYTRTNGRSGYSMLNPEQVEAQEQWANENYKSFMK